MGIFANSRQANPSRWRVITAVAAFALLCGCAERAYLADDGWRGTVSGLSSDQTPVQAYVPNGTGTDTANEDPGAGASISASDYDACVIQRLSGGDEPTASELRDAFTCIGASLNLSFSKSGHILARSYSNWTRVTSTPFFSEAIGDRYGVVYANARALGLDGPINHFDRGFPVGSTLAIPTFTLSEEGKVAGGPLILVEKMEPGFFALQGNWRYTIVAADGHIVAATRGGNEEDVSICADCTHSQTDLLYATLLNDGIEPYAEGAGPVFPSQDTYGSSGGLVAPSPNDAQVDSEIGAPGIGTVLDPNASVFDPNAPLDPDAPIFDPNAPTTDG
ncbi:hypothetical protein EOI86_00640 [Hwanghaeella grinnelliae]|uniref:Uncharacterized protein n=1 Tax=Hwanghaeella grinnelliae TaxID=2500179 RepID=A0A3S2VQF3_9PROT|nr:hypothetical protein [Hwanghaeella grinnelliae]RVU37844.1 hypothetical protein EOI86_00640 [Hwanghaeella grinnelliae]